MDGDSHARRPGEGLRFLKMHGLGNDFVVIDVRAPDAAVPSPEMVRALGDRHRGIGFDQLVLLSEDADGDARVAFFNADGSEAAACGNATRCVARLLIAERGSDAVTLHTGRGTLRAEAAGGGLIRVNMGQPQTDWRDVPLARAVDLDALPIPGDPGAVGMGNPHCVFFVADAEASEPCVAGPPVERHPLFPERTNVEFVQVLDRDRLRMRVWERGGGVTLACGSGACAAAVVAARRGLADRRVTVLLDGGPLEIDWREDGVWMTGPATLVFEGRLAADFAGLPA